MREMAQVIGLLVSSLPAVQYGPLFYRNLEIDKSPDATISRIKGRS